MAYNRLFWIKSEREVFIKQDILDYIRRPIPKGLPIVSQSIPIVFFGDIEAAKYATIAINPSNRATESLQTQSMNHSPKKKKRFIDRDAFSVDNYDTFSSEQAEKVYQSLRNFYGSIMSRCFITFPKK